MVDFSRNPRRASLSIHQIKKFSRGGILLGTPTERAKKSRRLPAPLKLHKVRSLFIIVPFNYLNFMPLRLIIISCFLYHASSLPFHQVIPDDVEASETVQDRALQVLSPPAGQQDWAPSPGSPSGSAVTRRDSPARATPGRRARATPARRRPVRRQQRQYLRTPATAPAQHSPAPPPSVQALKSAVQAKYVTRRQNNIIKAFSEAEQAAARAEARAEEVNGDGQVTSAGRRRGGRRASVGTGFAPATFPARGEIITGPPPPIIPGVTPSYLIPAAYAYIPPRE